MSDILEDNKVEKLKHSKLSKVAFGIFLSPVIIIGLLIGIRLVATVRYFSIQDLENFFNIGASSIVASAVISIVLSIIDLLRPKRRKFLPLAILTIYGLIIGIGIISILCDVMKIFS